MSTIEAYPIEYAAKLIEDINGNNPFQESKELYEYAAGDEATFSKLVDRRVIEHEPVAYITNHAKFRGLDLFIDERVLVPRSETEPLVEIAVEELPKSFSIIDVGTGCGEIALAIKNERPDLNVAGSDISKDALDVASINSEALEIEIDWYEADLLSGIKSEFSAVVANLPYLPTIKRASYEPEMVDHEPQVALWGGLDGYDLIRNLLDHTRVRKGVEFVALEIGLGQETDVCDLVQGAGFKTVFCTTDNKGDIRAVIGKR
jgi:release factor glutamine methyltransferase